MPTPPHIDHSISLADAAVLTKRFRDANPGSIKGGFFWKDQLIEMLNNSKAIGMRYYYGLDINDSPVLVLTAVDGNGNDLCENKELLMELSAPCPTYCSDNNPLNNG